MSRGETYNHLVCDGFIKNYIHWILHREGSLSHSHDNDLINDFCGVDVNTQHDMQQLLHDIIMSNQSESIEGLVKIITSLHALNVILLKKYKSTRMAEE